MRYTTHNGRLYAIVMRWPPTGSITLTAAGSSKGKVVAMALLGSHEKVQWQQSADGLHVTMPPKSAGMMSPTLRIELQ